MTGWAALSAAALTAATLLGGRRGAGAVGVRLRLARALHGRALAPGHTGRRPLLAGVAVAALALLVLGPVAGVLLGVPAGLAAARGLAGVARAPDRQRRARVLADLPLFCDLVAAQLTAGASLLPAAEAAADAVPGPLGTAVAESAAAIRLGAAGEPAWSALAGGGESLRPLARLLARARSTGSGAAEGLRTLAEEVRAQQRQESEAAARRAEALAVAPLGLCFLPAFVLLGVLPLIAGLVSGALGGLLPGLG